MVCKKELCACKNKETTAMHVSNNEWYNSEAYVYKPVVKVKKLDNFYALPEYAHDTDSGMDLFCTEDFYLYPGKTIKVPTGIAIELPKNFEAQIRSRSSMAAKSIVVVNGPGTIDNAYKGQIFVLLHKLLSITEVTTPMFFAKGSKIAQMVISPVVQATLQVVDKLEETDRGSNGFGSTDKPKQ